MNFDRKKTEVDRIRDISQLIDREGSAEDLERLCESMSACGETQDLLAHLEADQRLLQDAIPASLPSDSHKRLEDVISREFERRAPQRKLQLSRAQAITCLAASLLLVVATLAADQVWMQIRIDRTVASLSAQIATERMLLAQTIQDAMETQVTGEPVQIGQHGNWPDRLTPIQTYRSASGHWCRNYVRETRFGDMDLTILGTACRNEDGVWTTVFAEPVDDDFAPESPGI